MKSLHQEHYTKNKEKILQRQREYKAENPDKVKEYKQKYSKKLWAQNKDNEEFRERHRELARKWRQDNIVGERERDKRYSKRIVEELADTYIKDKLTRGTTLKNSDIPQELIEFKRTVMLAKRLVRLKTRGKND